MVTRKTTKKAATKKAPVKKPAAKKTVAKKAVAKKTPVKKAVAKKTVAKKAPATTAIKDSFNKSQTFEHIANETGLSKAQVKACFESLDNLVLRHLKKRAAGEFTLPGLLKCRVVRKPATKSRKGINPFTGEETTFKAKPARNVVKIRPLKKLKEMAE